MEPPHILDHDWINAHQQLIRSWSPFTLLWSLHHDIIVLSRHAIYDLLLKQYTVAQSHQEHLLHAIEEHRRAITPVVDWMIPEYTRHDISSHAHEQVSIQDTAYDAAVTIILRLHQTLNIHAPAMQDLSLTLLNETSSTADTDYSHLFQMAADVPQKLLAIDACLMLWMNAQPGST